MNPHSKFVQSWTKFFALSCLLAIFIDPLFFFLIFVKQVCFFPPYFASHVLVFLRLQQSLALQNDKCIMIDWPMAKAFVAVRSVTDILFSVNILLQVCFLFAYVTL